MFSNVHECPLCGCDRSRPSWLGAVKYLHERYPYVECCDCGSLYAQRVPNAQTLNAMYGKSYLDAFDAAANEAGAAASSPVIEVLASQPVGRFLDFGCGAGGLLQQARHTGWQCYGAEYDSAVAASVAVKTGLMVMTVEEVLAHEHFFDVVHLGDVIEHFSNAPQQFTALLRTLRPGGLLLAQGPLENNTNLFQFLVKHARRLRKDHDTEMPLYHLMLATAKGQREFFERHRLQMLKFDVSEVAWPAPARLGDIRFSPRALLLWALRKSSQVVGRFAPGAWGNRYFYVGVRAA